MKHLFYLIMSLLLFSCNEGDMIPHSSSDNNMAIYIVKEGKVLMAKKTQKVGIGCWFGFGGKKKWWESIRACAIRETWEETGGVKSKRWSGPWGEGGIKIKKRDLIPMAQIDFYRGDPVDSLVLSGLDHVMVFTAAEMSLGGGQDTFPLVHQRTYYMKLKKDPKGGKAPVPYLTPSGPDMDFRVSQ